MECLGLAPAGTGEPGKVLERWFREILLGLSGSLASGLQAGWGWRDLPNSCALQDVRGAEVADTTRPPELPAEPPE